MSSSSGGVTCDRPDEIEISSSSVAIHDPTKFRPNFSKRRDPRPLTTWPSDVYQYHTITALLQWKVTVTFGVNWIAILLKINRGVTHNYEISSDGIFSCPVTSVTFRYFWALCDPWLTNCLYWNRIFILHIICQWQKCHFMYIVSQMLLIRDLGPNCWWLNSQWTQSKNRIQVVKLWSPCCSLADGMRVF